MCGVRPPRSSCPSSTLTRPRMHCSSTSGLRETQARRVQGWWAVVAAVRARLRVVVRGGVCWGLAGGGE
eukprot:7248299-Prymnesium_polylepis.1